jgi:hypothetical protein
VLKVTHSLVVGLSGTVGAFIGTFVYWQLEVARKTDPSNKRPWIMKFADPYFLLGKSFVYFWSVCAIVMGLIFMGVGYSGLAR